MAARTSHTGTLLPSGKLLVVAGFFTPDPNTEIYDFLTGTWSPAANLSIGRSHHTATLLTNGKVLVAGGRTNFNGSPRATEIYDPLANTWTSGGDLVFPRSVHTATLLPDGKVLVVGGSEGTARRTAELYDPDLSTVAISGRVLTPAGIGLRSATVVLSAANGARLTTVTSSFGSFSFVNLKVGSYILNVSSKRYRFAPLQIQIVANAVDLNLVGLE